MLNLVATMVPATAGYIAAFETVMEVLMGIGIVAMALAVVYDNFRAEMLSEEA